MERLLTLSVACGCGSCSSSFEHRVLSSASGQERSARRGILSISGNLERLLEAEPRQEVDRLPAEHILDDSSGTYPCAKASSSGVPILYVARVEHVDKAHVVVRRILPTEYVPEFVAMRLFEAMYAVVGNSWAARIRLAYYCAESRDLAT